MADRNGNRRSDPDRSVAHHDRRELEHHLGEPFATGENDLLRPTSDLRQSDGEENREEYDLQDFVLGGRLEEALRHYVLEKAHPRRRRLGELLPLLCRRMDRHADARLDEVGGAEPDEQRDRRDDLEIDDGFERETADALHVVAVSRDPDDERAKYDRHEDRLDHPQEDRRQRLQRHRERRKSPTDDNANHHRDHYPRGERDASQALEDHPHVIVLIGADQGAIGGGGSMGTGATPRLSVESAYPERMESASPISRHHPNRTH